jgi:hypothetical protein
VGGPTTVSTQETGRIGPVKKTKGRVERALDRDLAGSAEIGPGGRAHLRAQAHAVDLAELQEDVELMSKSSHTYLEVRQSYGLAGIQEHDSPTDPFTAFVAGLSAPGFRDPADPE